MGSSVDYVRLGKVSKIQLTPSLLLHPNVYLYYMASHFWLYIVKSRTALLFGIPTSSALRECQWMTKKASPCQGRRTIKENRVPPLHTSASNEHLRGDLHLQSTSRPPLLWFFKFVFLKTSPRF